MYNSIIVEVTEVSLFQLFHDQEVENRKIFDFTPLIIKDVEVTFCQQNKLKYLGENSEKLETVPEAEEK